MPIDRHDAGIGWTVQQGAALPEDEYSKVPGQVYHVSQLPDRDRQADELGANYPDLYDNVGGHFEVLESREEAELHPQGPEPHELARGEVRREIVERETKRQDERKAEQEQAAEEAAADREGEPQPEAANSGAPVEGETAADSDVEVAEPAAAA